MINPDMSPEGLLRHELSTDESLEEEVKQDIEQSKYDKLAQKVEEYSGVPAEDIMNFSEEEDQDDGTEALAETEAELQGELEIARRVYAKILKRPEFSHLAFDDPVTLPIAQRLYAQDPAAYRADKQAFAEKLAQCMTEYRGLGPAQRQRGQQQYADGIRAHREAIKDHKSRPQYIADHHKRLEQMRSGG